MGRGAGEEVGLVIPRGNKTEKRHLPAFRTLKQKDLSYIYNVITDSSFRRDDVNLNPLLVQHFGELAFSLFERGRSRDGDLIGQYTLLEIRDMLEQNPEFRDQIHSLVMDDLEESRSLIGNDNYDIDPAELVETEKGVAHFFATLDSLKGSQEDLLRAAEEAGFEVSFPGEPFFEGSVAIGKEKLLFYSNGIISKDSRGVSANRFQKMPIEEHISLTDAGDNLPFFVDDLEVLGLPTEEFHYFLREVESTSEYHDVAHQLQRLQRTVLGLPSTDNLHFRDGSLESATKERFHLSMKVGDFADSIDKMAEIIQDIESFDQNEMTADERKNVRTVLSDARKLKKYLDDNFSGVIDETMADAQAMTKRYGADISEMPRSRIMALQGFHEALSSLNRSENINNAALWSYFSDVFESENTDEWRRKAAKIWALEVPQKTKMIYGALLVQNDPKLARKLEQSYAKEEDLRLRSRLLGEIPEGNIIYMPENWWTVQMHHDEDPNSVDRIGGVHLRGHGATPSFAFLSAPDPEKVTVHELIHSLQPSFTPLANSEGLDKIDARMISTSIEESLTETLAQVRTNEDFAKNISVENIPEGCSYPEHVTTLLRVLDMAGIKQDDRELAIEAMNKMDRNERLSALRKLLGKRKKKNTSKPLTFWQQLLLENHPEAIDYLKKRNTWSY
jgi:hypothetical protein